jgi:2,3-bisphosphoglycerate-independent phosphoglycerate mutase
MNDHSKAKAIIDQIKKCSDSMNSLLQETQEVLSEEDFNDARRRVGEFMGYMNWDIFRKYVVSRYPDLKESLG